MSNCQTCHPDAGCTCQAAGVDFEEPRPHVVLEISPGGNPLTTFGPFASKWAAEEWVDKVHDSLDGEPLIQSLWTPVEGG